MTRTTEKQLSTEKYWWFRHKLSDEMIELLGMMYEKDDHSVPYNEEFNPEMDYLCVLGLVTRWIGPSYWSSTSTGNLLIKILVTNSPQTSHVWQAKFDEMRDEYYG